MKWKNWWSPLRIFLPVILVLYLLLSYSQENVSLDDDIRPQAPGKFISLAAGKTHYELTGADSAKIIVLIAGGASGYYDWDNNVPALQKAGFRILRYDLYGRGWSDRPKTDYDLSLFDNQLMQLLDSLHIDKPFALAGFSMGAITAIHFADLHPERVSHLILADPAALNGPPAWYFNVPLLSDWLMTVYWYPRTVKRQMGQYFHPEKVPEYAEKLKVQMQFRGYKRAVLSSWKYTLSQNMGDVLAKIGKHPRPVLLLWGKHDPLVPVAAAQTYLKALPQARLVTLAEAGHAACYERPDLANPALLHFLK
jgi:pimeloyl-ACP methyl ester carboxylesterase